jgi:methyl-accepting chemotaxis protein
MKWFHNIQISKKLTLVFMFFAFITALVGFIGYRMTTMVMTAMDETYAERLVPIRDLGYANAALLMVRGDVRNTLAARDPQSQEKYMQSVRQQSAVVDSIFAVYRTLPHSQQELDTFTVITEHWKSYQQLCREAFTLVDQNRTEEAAAFFDGPARKHMIPARNSLRSLIEMNSVRAELLDRESDRDARNGASVLLTMLIGSSLLSLFMGLFIARTIANPVKVVVTNIRNADLNSCFNSDRGDEIGDLQRAFDGFVEQIKQTLIRVSESSAAVASASTQISSSSEVLAASAQEQSAQAGEVAAAVEEMTKTLGETTKNVRTVADGAHEAKESARKGGEVVGQTISGMKRIAVVVNQSAEQVKILGESSDKIGEIIGVIDEIADQTNLLALNAAIEAARAGEQGRGFAVVADEVRKLAERTSKATKEIAAMIRQIQTDTKQAVSSMEKGTHEVSSGIELVEQAGVMLNAIVGNAQSVADMVGQIATASEEQSSASEQISRNVDAINSVTQESASGTQQIAQTAEDLNRLTEQLQELLDQFKLNGSSANDQPMRSHHPKRLSRRNASTAADCHLAEAV